MIGDKEVNEILTDHRQWVSTNEDTWSRIRGAYEDKFWEDGTSSPLQEVLDEGYPIKVSPNRVRSWVQSHEDAVYYKGLNPTVTLDVLEGEGQDLDAPRRVASVLKAFVDRTLLSQIADDGQTMGLLYPSFAFKVGVDKSLGKHPIDQVWVEALPPWECVWDRRARTGRAPRYMGHLYQEKRSIVLKSYEESAKALGVDLASVAGEKSVDALGARLGSKAEGAYVRILELYDLTADTTVPTDDGERHVKGQRRIYLVDSGKDAKSGGGLRLIYAGPHPLHNARGVPVAPIVPGVLSRVPDKPMEGIPSAKTIYDLQSEQALVTTFLANATRRDAARNILYNKEKLGRGVEELTKGKDQNLIAVEGPTLEGIVAPVDLAPVSSTVWQYYAHLDQVRQQTSGNMAPSSRGEPTRYVTAFESRRLAQTTEGTLGHLRKRMDSILSKVLEVVLLAVRRAMGNKPFSVFVDGEWLEVTREMLSIRWSISVSDAAATPMAEMALKEDAETVLPKLTEILQLVSDPEAQPVLVAGLKQMYRYLRDLYNLPDDLGLDIILQLAEEEEASKPPEEPAPAPMPEAPPMPGPPPLPPEPLPAGGLAAPLPPAAQAIANAYGGGGG